jgi:CMP-N,N'-diacetyllegionaminic acid synthase
MTDGTMDRSNGVLAVIPARGGSKGLPGKNIRPLAGLPLIAHTILMARACPQIDRCIVSTDSAEIASVARRYGADVPFMRPAELAQDDTAIWPVLRHALYAVEESENRCYDYLLLLDPTSPARLPEDIDCALRQLEAVPEATGIIGVSQPSFNPMWVCVTEKDGWMVDLVPEAAAYVRRQDVPTVYRINAVLYLWRADFARRQASSWRINARNLIYEVPEHRAIHIDYKDEFDRAELLLRNGLLRFPWLDTPDR